MKEKILYYRDDYLPELKLKIRIGATAAGVAYISGVDEAEMTRFFKEYQFYPLKNQEYIDQALEQLHQYDQGGLTDFKLKLDLVGTDFQQQVWQALSRQPYGTLTTYSELAAAIGRPQSVRAVANAVGRNPLLMVIPCHRVIGKDGSLTGFRSGLSVKRSLLIREGLSEFR